MTSHWVPALAMVLACFVPVAARADAVGFPTTCPAGTRGDGCHGAEYCSPQACTRDSECAAGLRCLTVDFCVRTESCFSFDGTTRPVSDYYQACGDGPCPEGACESARVCATPIVPPPSDAGRPRDSGPSADAGSGRTHARYGCGCEVPAPASPLVPLSLAGLALGIVALVLARRR